MDIEAAMVLQTKPKEKVTQFLEKRKFSTVNTFIIVHISMFTLQAFLSAYEARPIASKMFLEGLPWFTLTFFAAFCKQMYHISRKKGIAEPFKLYRQNEIDIWIMILCYAGMLVFTLLLTYFTYKHYIDDPLKSGRYCFVLVCMNTFLWCAKELTNEEEQKRRKRLMIVSSLTTGAMFANCVFGLVYFHSSDLYVSGAVSTPVFLVVSISAYSFHCLTEEDQLINPVGSLRK